MKLDNWYVSTEGGIAAAYRAGMRPPPPDCPHPSLCGTVTGSPIFKDGEFVITSPIVASDPATNSVLTKSGSLYELGEPDEFYEKAYTRAKFRLINSLK